MPASTPGLVLGIETSCDETSAAVLDGDTLLSHVILSQDVHKVYSGVVPELAARAHMRVLDDVVRTALDEAGTGLGDIGAFGVTAGPGLIGALLVGVTWTKATAWALDRPLVGVHHMEAHLFAASLEDPDAVPPFVALLVSGGHTMLLWVPEWGRYELLGATRDDAAGEAFDKIAKFFNLDFPGGPVIDKLSKEGNRDYVRFPRPMLRTKSYDFSFSGLKTAVINKYKDKVAKNAALPLADIAASFQEAVVDVLVTKTMRAAIEKNVKAVSVTGGVSANSRLREAFTERCEQEGLKVYFPPLSLCTDNAAMIAAAGYAKLQRGEVSDLRLNVLPNVPLEGV